jgi:ribbon-helix-helix CopG family protein
MAAREQGKASGGRRSPGSLWREQAYLYDDEEKALAERARKDRCSKAEIIRRALRAYLEIKD